MDIMEVDIKNRFEIRYLYFMVIQIVSLAGFDSDSKEGGDSASGTKTFGFECEASSSVIKVIIPRLSPQERRK